MAKCATGLIFCVAQELGVEAETAPQVTPKVDASASTRSQLIHFSCFETDFLSQVTLGDLRED